MFCYEQESQYVLSIHYANANLIRNPTSHPCGEYAAGTAGARSFFICAPGTIHAVPFTAKKSNSAGAKTKAI